MAPAAPAPVTATLLVSCGDRTGLVAALSEFVFQYGGNILDADQHAEVETGLFFMRLVWDLAGFKLARPQIQSALEMLATRFQLTWELTYSDVRPRVAVFASRSPHCLYDLLLAHQLGELGGDLVAVVSNHDDLRSVAGHFGVRFEHIPIAAGDKPRAEATTQRLLGELAVDLVVLARYMQILTPAFVAKWPARIINIHHSFLPAFVGAQAVPPGKGARREGDRRDRSLRDQRSRSGADHRSGRLPRQPPRRRRRAGAEGRRAGTPRADARVRLHLERRVLLSGNRTIVFGG
jgi:formyltetrahydrofolate deformylase